MKEESFRSGIYNLFKIQAILHRDIKKDDKNIIAIHKLKKSIDMETAESMEQFLYIFGHDYFIRKNDKK